MAISYSTGHGGNAGSSTAATTSGAITVGVVAGECVIVAVGTVNTASNAPTDNAAGGGNKYTLIGTVINGTAARITLWACLNAKATTAITCTFGSSRWGVAISAYSGVKDLWVRNTASGNGTTSPFTVTLPNSLSAGDFSVVGYASRGTGTWGATTGTLRDKIVGAGSTTPGVAILDNTATGNTATNTSLSSWAGFGFEMGSVLIRAYDDEPSTRHAIWVDGLRSDKSAFRYYDLNDPEIYFPPTSVLPTGEYFILVDAHGQFWRITINDVGISVAKEILNGPASNIFLNDSAAASTSWQLAITTDGFLQPASVTFNSSYATQYPILTTPSALQTEITIVNGVMVVASPYRISNDDDQYIPALWTGRPTSIYDNSSDDATFIAQLPVVPHIGLDDLDSTFHFLEQHTVYDHTSDTDEPGGLGLPIISQEGRFGLAEEEIMVGDVMDFGFATAPTFASEDEFYQRPSMLLTTLSQEKFDGAYPVTAVVVPLRGEEEMPPIWAGTKALGVDDSDSNYPITVVPVVPNIGLDDIEANFRSYEQRSVYDHTQDTDEPGGLAAPPVSQEGRFGIAEQERTIGDVLDFGFAIAPTFASEDEFYQQSFTQLFSWTQEDLDNPFVVPPIVVVTNAGLDDIESSFKTSDRIPFINEEDQALAPRPPASIQDGEIERVYDQHTVYDHTAETDEPGVLGPPAFAIQDEIAERWSEWRQIYHDDLETQQNVPPIPPRAVVDEADAKFDANWKAPALEDDRSVAAPTPPTVKQDDDPMLWSGVTSLRPDDPDSYYPPSPPRTIDQDSENSQWTGWKAPALEDDHTFAAPAPPRAIQEDGDNELRRDWYSPALEDDSRMQTPPPPLTIDQDTEQSLWFARSAFELDDTDSTFPPAPIVVVPTRGEEDIPSIWNGWLQNFQDDAETQRAVPPTPPPTIDQEPQELKWSGWSAPAIEDDWTAATPNPPLVDDPEIEKWLAWSTYAIEEDLNSRPPNPPFAIQEEGDAEKVFGWSALQPEDIESNIYPPLPPEVEPETADDFEAQAQIANPLSMQPEDAETGIPPTPPSTLDQDTEQSFWTGWKAPALEDDLSSAAPTPPVASDSDPEKWSEVRSVQPEDDTLLVVPPAPPTTFQEEPIEKWSAGPPVIDAQDLDGYKTPPPPPVVPEGWEFEDYLPHAQDHVIPVYEDAETQRVLPPTPPTTQQTEEAENKFDAGWRARQYEDTETQRVSPPTPPTTQQTEEAENKFDAGWRTRQYEDTETQRGSAPTPPTTFTDDGENKFDASWRARQYEDTETQRVSPPTPPTTFEEEYDFLAMIQNPYRIDDSDLTYPITPPPIAPNIGLDDIEATFKPYQQSTVYDHTPETDEPGSLGPPPSAIDQDSEQSRWFGWGAVYDHTQDTDEPGALAAPSRAIQDEISERWTGWQQIYHDDLETQQNAAPPPPVVEQEEGEIEKWTGWLAPALEDDHSFISPIPPIVIPDDAESMRWTGTRAIQHDDTDTQRTSTPTPPTTFTDDGENKFDANWRTRQYEDTDTQRTSPPTPPTTFTDDGEVKFDANWRQKAHEDTETQRGLPPTPPTSYEPDEASKFNAGWIQNLHDDTETNRTEPPTPPPAIQDEISELFVGTVQPWHEDTETQSAAAPTPPIADDVDHQQMSWPPLWQYDEALAAETVPPPPPLFIGAGRDDQELQSWREFPGPYYESIHEQWIWFSGFIYPSGVLGSGTIQASQGVPTVSEIGGTAETIATTGDAKISPIEGTGESTPTTGDGKVNNDDVD